MCWLNPEGSRLIAAAGWVGILLLCRWLSRLALRRYRGGSYYGMTALALAAAFTAAVQIFWHAGPWPRVAMVAVRLLSSFVLLLMTAPWYFRKEQLSALLSSWEKP